MEFQGPEAADFNNVHILNFAWLSRLRQSAGGQQLRQSMPFSVRVMIKALTDMQVERLSATPFLLLSVRERDDDYWHDLFDVAAPAELFMGTATDAETGQLAAAGVAFLWHLARRNPYATRLVSGATLSWCERLANCTLLRLLRQTSGRNDLLQPRLANREEFWSKLLGPGISSETDVRHAAHLAALQSILTEDPALNYRPVSAAACTAPTPALHVAERNNRR